MNIRPLKYDDTPEWVRLKKELDPEAEDEELVEEMPAYLEDGDRRLYTVVAERPDGTLAGILELELRAQAEGCISGPVACITGWFVDPDCRRQGISRQMLALAEIWARKIGCAEIASSCVIENTVGMEVHEALGFEDVGKLAHYVYELHAEG